MDKRVSLSPDPPSRAAGGAPDAEAPEALHPVYQFVLRLWMDYRTPVIGGLLTLLVLAVALGYLNRQRGQRENDAARALNEAAFLYNQVVLTPDVSQEAADAQLANAIDLLDGIQTQYRGTWHAHWALFLEGSCHYERVYHYQAQPEADLLVPILDDAIDAFRRYREEATDPLDRARGHIAVAACYENRSFFTGDAEFMHSAIEELDAAIGESEGTHLQAQALIAKGRCLEALDRLDEARQVYAEVQRRRESLQTTSNQGGIGTLVSQGGYSDQAAQLLARIEAGIATPSGS